jgi:ABC-type branched-subunit amino acid transport system substrate-binding protein
VFVIALYQKEEGVLRRLNIVPSLIAAAVLAATIGLAACGGDGGGGGKAKFDLTIGDIVPLTGDLADFGPPGRKAADLAVQQIKDAIKKDNLDQTVTIKHEDEQTDPEATVSAGRKLVDGGASCITGAYASSDTIPLARSVSIREKVLQISPASTSDEITPLKDDGLLNRTAPPDKFQGPAVATAISNDLGGSQGKTVNVGARNDAYGTGLAGTFAAAWQKKGGKIGQKVIYDPKQPSYNSEAQKITSGNPDAFVIIDFPETFNKVAPALVRTGKWDPKKAWGTDGLASSALPKSAGTEATEGFRGTAPGAPEKNPEPAEAFDRLYTQAPGPRRQTFDAQLFDAVVLCYLSAVAAGEADGEKMAAEVRDISAPPGESLSWEQLPKAIKALQDGKDINYIGAAGEIDMNDAGDATSGVYDLYRYKGGKIDIYSELPIPKQ